MSASSANPAPTGFHGKSTPAPFLTPDKRASTALRHRASATAPQTPSGVASSGQPSSSYRGKRLGLDSSPPSSASSSAAFSSASSSSTSSASSSSSSAAAAASAASAASQTCACTTGLLHLHLRGTGWGQAVEAACSYCGLRDDAARGDGAGARLLGQWYACAHVLVPGEGGGEQSSCVRAGGCGLSAMDVTGTFAGKGSGRGGAKAGAGAGAGAGGSAGASGHRSTRSSKRGRRGDGGGGELLGEQKQKEAEDAGGADAKGAEGAEGGGASAAKKRRASTTTVTAATTTAPLASTKEEDGIAAWAAQRQHRLSRLASQSKPRQPSAGAGELGGPSGRQGSGKRPGGQGKTGTEASSPSGTSTASVASAILGIDDILGKR